MLVTGALVAAVAAAAAAAMVTAVAWAIAHFGVQTVAIAGSGVIATTVAARQGLQLWHQRCIRHSAAASRSR